MTLPKIDLASLPVLESAAGMFGSLSDAATAASDDRAVIVMVYLYETGSKLPDLLF
ncbi:hypothetical protein [Pelagerythrobacter marensis]|uniref:Uncharacterized protein n=1 Tax=Pelagerythrobacter marensis TaxID=543877 RepID=A0A0G3XA06_9SPHN|nr:hypothetical protein [Pelagerythrobacter marensis]AKM07466.1 hypothetical protein AM2010_1394 [Pelagerythrobacter marensis]